MPTVAELLRHKNEKDALHILQLADIELVDRTDDDWRHDVEIWTAYLRVPVRDFVRIENNKHILEAAIRSNMATVLGSDAEFSVQIEISPMKLPPLGSKIPDGKISDDTRSAVIDEMRARETQWNGALDEVVFLGRMFDLSTMPSNDPRYDSAEGDIWQHRINNDDWPIDWVYDDNRFRLYELAQERFLKFITEVLHPIVRKDASEQRSLVTAFNGHLHRDGWELVEDLVIDGRPMYVAERKRYGVGNSVQRIKAVAASLDSDNLYEDLRRLERIGDSEPGETIALAKEIVESCCKLILDDRGVSYRARAEYPELLKLLRQEVKIMPDGIGEGAKAYKEIREVLASLGRIAHALGPIRNAYGKGHGRGREFKGLEPRHARLAIGAASTFVDFVLDRHRGSDPRRLSN